MTLEALSSNSFAPPPTILGQELMLGTARNRYLLDRTGKSLRRTALAQREMLKRGLFRPQARWVTFGTGGGGLPAFRVQTPAGAEAASMGRSIGSTASRAMATLQSSTTGLARADLSSAGFAWLVAPTAHLSARARIQRHPTFRQKARSCRRFYLQLIRRIEDVSIQAKPPIRPIPNGI